MWPGSPVRNAAAVESGRHYGLTVATCVPYDPASKGMRCQEKGIRSLAVCVAST
jgi:hypothetical protein